VKIRDSAAEFMIVTDARFDVKLLITPGPNSINYMHRIADGIYLLSTISSSNLLFTYNAALTLLLRLLNSLLSWCTVQPDSNERQPASNCDPNTTDPDPGTADLPTPWPLIVSKVPDSNLPLLVDV
jgi:hypothetical protein